VNDPVVGLALAAFALLLLVLPLSFWSLSGGGSNRWVTLLVAAANLCLTAQLVLRWWDSGHFPISNLYESLCFLAWGCIGVIGLSLQGGTGVTKVPNIARV
jgi:ABC-type transport system involved in cytochrome c biogenesis permease subunit